MNMSAALRLFRKAFFEVLGQRTNLMRVGYNQDGVLVLTGVTEAVVKCKPIA